MHGFAPDCAQGVFHDYWISLRGADGTTRPRKALGSPRVICDGRFTYVRPVLVPLLPRAAARAADPQRSRSPARVPRSAVDSAVRLHQRGDAERLQRSVRADAGVQRRCAVATPKRVCAALPTRRSRASRARQLALIRSAARATATRGSGERSPSSRTARFGAVRSRRVRGERVSPVRLRCATRS